MLLRAFYYLQLVKLYGDLPIIKDVKGVNSSYAGMVREPAWKVLQFVVEDCEAAMELKNCLGVLPTCQTKTV